MFTTYYTGTKPERMKAALKEARDYVGHKEFKEIMDTLMESVRVVGARKTVRTAYFYLSFAGLRGAPARAMLLRALQASRVIH